MKPEELRIGNIFMYKGNEITFEVNDFAELEHNLDFLIEPIELTEEWLIKFGFKKFKSDYGIERWYIRHYKNKGDKGYHEYHFQISEKLNKDVPMCGAIGIYHKAEKNIPAPTNDDIDRTIDSKESLVNFAYYIKYVDQVQNLYFALTGKELEIKQLTKL